MSIYQTLGREQGVRAAVDDFYRRVLADPQLASYFDGVDMARLRGHQARLLVQVTGGPAGYRGRDLAAAHEALGITPADFERVVEHLATTLADLGVDEGTVGQVGTALAAYRDDIVT
jgi:hemoglobin